MRIQVRTAPHALPAEQPNPVRQRRGAVSAALDKAQAHGRLVVGLDELVAASGLTPLAVKRQLEHVRGRATRMPGRPSGYLIVPPEHRTRGAPPIETWLGDYFRLRGQAYYLGLLSAAAKYGSSQQAVQVIQVITGRPMPPMVLGRMRIEFHVKAGLERTPLTEIRGLAAPLAVSSAAATALDLVAFNQSAGGIERVVEVISGLLPNVNATGLGLALAAESRVSVKQRMGYILEGLGATRLAENVRRSLPARTARVLLQPAGPASSAPPAPPWNVVDNLGIWSGKTAAIQ